MATEQRNDILYLTPELLNSEEDIWVNPVGGYGDVILLSTAMKRSYDKYGHKFCLARRSQYTEMLKDHPAVKVIGNPPLGCNLVTNDYWSREEFNDPHNKGLAITQRIFGVEYDGDETTYLPIPEPNEATKIQLDFIPWREKNVLIACASESPRKMMHPIKWHVIVQKLLAQQCFVLQVGRHGEIPIVGAYSILGTTTPHQVIEMAKRADLVITPDNFIMHAAHLVGTPTISLFGPTEGTRYGYNDQIIQQTDTTYCPEHEKCIGPHVADNYSRPCPLCEDHCMNRIDENKVVDIAMSILNQ